ncbi:MAG: ABC transporter permease [Spirochaetia bacterium]
MKIKTWILFVANRYFYAKKRKKGFTNSFLSILGLAAGVMTLITVIAVMNGFQLGYIENILQISSYHIRLYPREHIENQQVAEISETQGIESIVPFLEHEVLLKGNFPRMRGAALRGVPTDIMDRDSGFAENVEILNGGFDISNENTVVIGSELSRFTGVQVGDTIQVITLSGTGFGRMQPDDIEYTVTGIFRTGYYEYDLSWGFCSLETAENISVTGEHLVYGIKLDNPEQDARTIATLRNILSSDTEIESWREYNSAFFGALRIEKIMMTVLLGLIFIVVGANIYHSFKRMVYERSEEIGVLRALGASPVELQMVFLLNGVFIGSAGAVIGVILGTVISININLLFSGAEAFITWITQVIQAILSPVSGAVEGFSLFSPQYFYLMRVPVRLIPLELYGIALFAVFTAIISSVLAVRRISQIYPSEALRDE